MRKIILVTALLALIGPAAAVAQTTFTVNATDDVDDGTCDATHCSMREAVDTANALAGTDTIAFGIAGAGLHPVNLQTALPVISDAIVIDGTTQPGFSGDPLIELVYRGAGTADGLTVTAGSSTIRSLLMRTFDNAIVLDVAGSNLLTGNVLGLGDGGNCDDNSGAGLVISSSDNTIGGSSLTDANQILCNDGDGILITNANDNVVRGNFIGIPAPGDFDDAAADGLGNGGDGIRIVASTGNVIGGTGLQQRNVIARSGGAGISINGASSADNRVADNTIAENEGDGVVLPDAGTGNAIESNDIFGNGALGIDLEADGVTENDLGDNDTGPNDLQNYPVISSARIGTATFVDGVLRSSANNDFDIEVFGSSSCNTSGNGEGETFLTRDLVTTDGNGEVDLELIASVIDPGEYVTATATSSDGSTSEFSACVQATGYEVTVRPDSIITNQGGSARYAIDVDPLGGPYNDPVALRCISQPPFTSCSFSQDTVVPGANGVTSFLTIATNQTGISSVGPTDGVDGRLAVAWPGALGLGLPALGLGLFLLSDGRRRRRYGIPLLVALMLGGAALQTGCDDGNVNGPNNGVGTPPGRYIFQVQATSDPITVIETGILVVTL